TPAHTGTLPEGRRARPRAPAGPGRLRVASSHAPSEWAHSPQRPGAQGSRGRACQLLLCLAALATFFTLQTISNPIPATTSTARTAAPKSRPASAVTGTPAPPAGTAS